MSPFKIESYTLFNFFRSLQPTSSSTPISKLRSNISSKRKKIDKPKLKSPKSNAVATQQLNKRPKTTNVNSDFHADVENPISGTPSLPHHKQTSSLEYKNIEEPVDMPNPTTESQNVSQRLQNQSSSIEPTVVINDEEMKSNYNALKPKSNQLNLDVVKKVEVEQKNSSEIDKSPQQTELKELENDQTAQLEGKLQDANEDRYVILVSCVILCCPPVSSLFYPCYYDFWVRALLLWNSTIQERSIEKIDTM